MKEKIKKSGQYKRYIYYVILFGSLYLVLFVLSLLIPVLLRDIDGNVGWIIFGVTIGLFSLVFLPTLISYSLKCIILSNTADNYQILTGTITEIYTNAFLKNDSRDITVAVKELGNSIYLKVYKGELYDEVAKYKSVSIAYCEKNNKAILLDVI